MQEQELGPKHTFYFFINTRSGDGEGARLMELALNKREIQDRVAQPIEMHFVDLFDAKGSRSSYEHIREEIDRYSTEVYVVVCGGDGTVSWVINAMEQQ